MGIYLNKHTLLKNLCIAHPVINHTGTNADGSVRKSFFRINNEEEIISSIFNGIDFPCVAYQSFDGRLKDADNAMVDIRNVIKHEWWFIDNVTMATNVDGQGTADRIELAYDTTFDIMQDFLRAMKDDYETNGGCGLFRNFDLNRINYSQIGPVGENQFGWAMYFEDETEADILTGGSAVIPGGMTIITKANEPEIIWFTNEATKTVLWTSTRKQRFGNMPVVQIWIFDGDKYQLSALQPDFDNAPPAFTQMDFDFTGPATGFILIK